MKLVLAVVHNEDAKVLIDALLKRQHRATWLHSSGGFLKQSNATVLVGVEGQKLAGKQGTSVAGKAEPETASGKALVMPLGVSLDARTNTVVLSGTEAAGGGPDQF